MQVLGEGRTVETTSQVREYLLEKSRFHDKGRPHLSNFVRSLTDERFDALGALRMCFKERDRETQGMRSSVRYEAYALRLLSNLLDKAQLQWSISMQRRIAVEPQAPSVQVVAHLDFLVRIHDSMVVVELKKNIDNIYSDLFKFALMAQDPGCADWRKFEVVLEEENRANAGSTYVAALGWAKNQKVLDDWFYLYLQEDELNENIGRLEASLESTKGLARRAPG